VALLKSLERDGPTCRLERSADGRHERGGMRKAVARAGLGPLRWHDLRHTWASWALQGGASMMEVMQLGGWKSLAMVQRYSHLARSLAAAAGR